MTEPEIIEERYVDVRIFGIPEADFEYFREIIKAFEGDRVKAFKALLDSYSRELIVGEILNKIQALEERIKDLEKMKSIEQIKTFGGELK